MVSHPENGSDSPIGSDRDWGRDKYNFRSKRFDVSYGHFFTIKKKFLRL